MTGDEARGLSSVPTPAEQVGVDPVGAGRLALPLAVA